MEWSKAKSILIGVFVVLNLFLFVRLGSFLFEGGVPAKRWRTPAKYLKAGALALPRS